MFYIDICETKATVLCSSDLLDAVDSGLCAVCVVKARRCSVAARERLGGRKRSAVTY